jgi:hypothetical protein
MDRRGIELGIGLVVIIVVVVVVDDPLLVLGYDALVPIVALRLRKRSNLWRATDQVEEDRWRGERELEEDL